MRRDAIVLGGGITGLVSACRLRQAGWRVELVESSARLGGRLATHTAAGAAWELGAHTVAAEPELLEFARLTGVEADLLPVAAASRRRYTLHRDGRLVALPTRLLGWLTTPLLSPPSGMRLLAGRLGRWPPRAQPAAKLEPVLQRQLGKTGGSLLAASIATGVYAGMARDLLASEALSLAAPRRNRNGRTRDSSARGRRRLLRPRRGWQAWIDRAAEGMPIGLSTRALSARRIEEGFEVEVATPDGRRRLSATRLISALPAHESARVLAPLGIGAAFAAIPHAPLATVVLVCDTEQAERLPEGFGFLDPFDATGGLLGCIFASAIAPQVAPPHSHVLTALVGGSRHTELVEQSDESLVSHAWQTLTPLLGLRGDPRDAVVRRWSPGIPQPTSELLAARKAAARMEAANPGLRVLGDWLHGVGVPACVAVGWTIDTD